MSKPDISIIILTYNEQIHIQRCLKKIAPVAKNVFVIDSFSTDKTVEIAEAMGAKVFQRPWINYGDQFQWGLDNCPIDTKWTMRLDADEYLDDDLINELLIKIVGIPNDITGVCFRLNYKFLNRHIKYGDRNLVLLRLWRTGMAKIENRWMDEHIVLKDGKTVVYDNIMFDHNINAVSWFIDKHNRYATREMIDILNKKYNLFGSCLESKSDSPLNQHAKLKRWIKASVYNQLPLFIRPVLYFLYRYFLRLGFLDGKEGFAYHFMQGLWYRCLVDLKCLEAERVLVGAQSREEKVARLAELTGLRLE